MNINKSELKEVIDNIKRGNFVIPNFQRDFVWKPQSICYLLDSLIRGFPIGSFLLLPYGELKLTYTALNIMNAQIQTESKDNIKYILDGQQRITSIARAFLNLDPGYNYFLDIDVLSDDIAFELNIIKENTSSDKYIFDFIKKEKDTDILIKNNKISLSYLDDFNYERHLLNFIQNKYKKEFADSVLEQNVEKINNECRKKINAMFYYNFVMQELNKKEKIESICRIFETINDTGVKLTVFDLLVAKTFNNAFNLRQIFSKYIDDIIVNKNLPKILLPEENSFLHIFLYVKQTSQNMGVNLSKKELLNLKDSDFQEYMDVIQESTVEYYNWILNERIYKNFIPEAFRNLLIAINAKIKYKKLIKNSLFSKDFKNDIKKYIFIRMLSFKSPYNKSYMYSDAKDIINYIENNIPLLNNLENLSFTKEDILNAGNKSKIFSAIMSLLYNNTNKDISGETIDEINSLQEHHIIPKRTLEKNGFKKIEINSIANIILIPSKLNKNILDKNPDLYLSALLKQHNDIEIYKQLYLLPFDCNNIIEHNFSDYNTFLYNRGEKLTKLLNDYLSKKS